MITEGHVLSPVVILCASICGTNMFSTLVVHGHKVGIQEDFQGRVEDMTHLRWTKGLASTTITFTETMQLTVKKAQFLSNTENKQLHIIIINASHKLKNA